MGFSRQECCSGLPFPSPGDLHDPGIQPTSPALEADILPLAPPQKPTGSISSCNFLERGLGKKAGQVISGPLPHLLINFWLIYVKLQDTALYVCRILVVNYPLFFLSIPLSYCCHLHRLSMCSIPKFNTIIILNKSLYFKSMKNKKNKICFTLINSCFDALPYFM